MNTRRAFQLAGIAALLSVPAARGNLVFNLIPEPGTPQFAIDAFTTAANLWSSIIANNVISDFGYGHAHWIWGNDGSPFRFDDGQKPDNPPVSDVIIQGNIVYDTGRQPVIVDGKPKVEPPRYKYAVRIAGGERGPKGLHFSNHLFHPGTVGESNVELKP